VLLDTAERLIIRPLVASGYRLDGRWDVALLVLCGIGAGLVGVLLILGFVNHCSMERGPSRTWKQVVGIAGYIVAGVAMFLTLTML
jgi:H+/Cl- antiporter ClcA